MYILFNLLLCRPLTFINLVKVASHVTHISMNGLNAMQLSGKLKSMNQSSAATPSSSPTPLHETLTTLAQDQAKSALNTPADRSEFILNRPKSDPYELYQNDPELRAKAKILAERLDGPIIESNNNHFFYQGGMQDFLHAGLLTNTDFIDMTSSLSDKALEDFAQTIKTLYLPATENFTSHNEAKRTYQDKVAQFTDVLLNSNETDRNAILEKAASYAEQVDKGHLRAFKTTVLSQDFSQLSKLQRYRDDTSANNLHNYITAVIDSDNPVALTKQLGKMSDEAQAGLLSVSGLDTGLGERLAKLMGSDANQVPESLLTALAEIIGEIKVPMIPLKDYGHALTGDKALLKDNWQSQGRDFALDSVTNMISMMEKYDFSDKQLESMGTDLNALSNPEKRAYIEITTTGLDSMLQQKVFNRLNKPNLDEAMHIVDTLRQDKDVISLINRAQYHDVTLVERPYIEEGLTVVALEGAAVFQDMDTAIDNSRVLLGATNNVKMENGHSVKGHESENLYSAKAFADYKADVGNLVTTLVAFEETRHDSTAEEKMTLTEFTESLTDMHSGIRDEMTERVSTQFASDEFRSKMTENTQFAFFSSLVQQMVFETRRDFGESSGVE